MTTNCTFFDPATGGITQVAQLSDETLEHYISAGASAILDVMGNPDTQHAVQDASGNWALVDFTADELAARAVNELPARINAAVAKCYPDIDAIYTDAVGNRTEEYRDAESDARSFKAGGYVGVASDYVHDFALKNPTGAVQTDQWAADQIIARADAFASAKLSMRSQRFASQAAMRAAATDAELDAAVSDWNSFIATTRQNLGLPPAP